MPHPTAAASISEGVFPEVLDSGTKSQHGLHWACTDGFFCFFFFFLLALSMLSYCLQRAGLQDSLQFSLKHRAHPPSPFKEDSQREAVGLSSVWIGLGTFRRQISRLCHGLIHRGVGRALQPPRPVQKAQLPADGGRGSCTSITPGAVKFTYWDCDQQKPLDKVN